MDVQYDTFERGYVYNKKTYSLTRVNMYTSAIKFVHIDTCQQEHVYNRSCIKRVWTSVYSMERAIKHVFTVMHESKLETCTIDFVQYHTCQNVTHVYPFCTLRQLAKWARVQSFVVLFGCFRRRHVYNINQYNMCQKWDVYYRVLYCVTRVILNKSHIKFSLYEGCQYGPM